MLDGETLRIHGPPRPDADPTRALSDKVHGSQDVHGDSAEEKNRGSPPSGRLCLVPLRIDEERSPPRLAIAGECLPGADQGRPKSFFDPIPRLSTPARAGNASFPIGCEAFPWGMRGKLDRAWHSPSLGPRSPWGMPHSPWGMARFESLGFHSPWGMPRLSRSALIPQGEWHVLSPSDLIPCGEWPKRSGECFVQGLWEAFPGAFEAFPVGNAIDERGMDAGDPIGSSGPATSCLRRDGPPAVHPERASVEDRAVSTDPLCQGQRCGYGGVSSTSP